MSTFRPFIFKPFIFWPFIFGLFILLISVALRIEDQQCKTGVFKEREHFESGINNLRATFKNQEASLWQDIRTVGLFHFRNETGNSQKRPLVIMLVGFKQSQNVLDCIAMKVADTFAVDKPLVLRESILKGSSKRDWKAVLDDEIGAYLCESNTKVVNVQLLNILTYSQASIFYKYCDNANTKEEEAVFIFSLTIPEDRYKDATDKKMATGVLERYLVDDLWSETPEEQSMALAIRVADIVLFVRNEDNTRDLRALCSN